MKMRQLLPVDISDAIPFGVSRNTLLYHSEHLRVEHHRGIIRTRACGGLGGDLARYGPCELHDCCSGSGLGNAITEV